MCAHRTDQNDIALVAEERLSGVRAHDIGGEVGGEGVTQILLGHVGQTLGGNRGIDDHDVGRTQIRLGRGEKRVEPGFVGNIYRKAVAFTDLTDAGEGVIQMLWGAAADEDPGAFAREQDGDRAADAGGPAGYDRGASL